MKKTMSISRGSTGALELVFIEDKGYHIIFTPKASKNGGVLVYKDIDKEIAGMTFFELSVKL